MQCLAVEGLYDFGCWKGPEVKDCSGPVSHSSNGLGFRV